MTKKYRCKRFRELTSAAFLFIWAPLFESKKKFVLFSVLPALFVVFLCAILFTIIKVTDNDSPYDLNPDDVTRDENGYMQAYTVGELPLSIVCHNTDGTYKFNTCLGLINETQLDIFTVMTNDIIVNLADNNSSQYMMFNTENEAKRMVFDLAGIGKVPEDCAGCKLPTDFGYFAIFSIDRQTGEPTWTIALQDTAAARYIKNNSLYSSLRLVTNQDSYVAGAARLTTYIYDTLDAAMMSQIEPTFQPVNTVPITSIRSGVVSILADHPKVKQEFPFSIILMIPLLVATISASSSFSYECSITRCILQAGMHPLPLIIVGMSLILYQSVILIASTFLAWGIFDDTFGKIYNGKDFTFGVGIFLVILVTFGFFIESATIFVLFPRRVPAIVFVLCINMVGQGLMMLMQLQEAAWPYYVIAALIPSSVGAIAPTVIIRFRALALTSSLGPEFPDIIKPQSWKIGLSDILDSNFPTSYISQVLLNQTSGQHRIIIENLSYVIITSIVSIGFYILLLYCGYAIRPAEIGGPYKFRRLFTRIPRCKTLRTILDERYKELEARQNELQNNNNSNNVNKNEKTEINVKSVKVSNKLANKSTKTEEAQTSGDVFAHTVKDIKGKLEYDIVSSENHNISNNRHSNIFSRISLKFRKQKESLNFHNNNNNNNNNDDDDDENNKQNNYDSKYNNNNNINNNTEKYIDISTDYYNNYQTKSPLSMLLSPNHYYDELTPPIVHDTVVLSADNLIKEFKLKRRIGKKMIEIDEDRVKLKRKNPAEYVFRAVNDVSLEFYKGTTTGVIGENGAGKTTLLKLIMGTESLTHGKLELLGGKFGNDNNTGPLDILPLIGYVPQHDILGKFSCKLHCIIMARCRGLKGKEAKIAADETLQLVGLQGKANCIATTLSGGQKRRLMVAMALCGGPLMLILDEPEAGLSVDAKEELDESIRRVKTSEVSIILTEHDMSQIEELCDEVVVLKGGRIVSKGTPLELKDEHSGYTLRVSFDTPNKEISESLLEELNKLTETTIKHADGKDVTYSLSSSASNKIEAIADTVESIEGVVSYGIRTTTLGDAIREIIGDNEDEKHPPTNIEHSEQKYLNVLHVILNKCFWSLLRNKISLKTFADILIVFVMCGTFSIFIPDLTSFLMSTGGYVSIDNNPAIALAIGPVRWTGEAGNAVMTNWPDSIEFPYINLANELLDSSTPIVVFNAPGDVTIYTPPLSVMPTLLQHALALNINGLINGILPQPLMSGGMIRSFNTDDTYSTLPLLSWVIPLFALLCSLTVLSLCIVVPYFLVSERTSGFEGLMRLTGRRRSVNILSWTFCAIIPYSILNFGIAFLVSMIIAWRISSIYLSLDLDEYVKYALINGSCAAITQLTWAYFGIWISYKFKNTSTVLHIAPHMLWLMIIPYLICAAFMSFGTSDMSSYEANKFWEIFVWAFGIFPFSCCQTLLTNLIFYGFLPSVFVLNIDQALIIMGVNIILAILMFSIVFLREGIDEGFYNKLPKFIKDIICLGSSISLDVQQPSNKDREKRGYSDDCLPSEEDYKHPFEDETVTEERAYVRALIDGQKSLEQISEHDKKNSENSDDTNIHITKINNNGLSKDGDIEYMIENQNTSDNQNNENYENINNNIIDDYSAVFYRCRREFRIKLPDKSVGVIAAVRCLDLSIHKGECLGLVGENGAGKSTALSMAIGNISPSYGMAKLLVNRVGYVPQSNAHCPWLTVKQHVELFSVLGGVKKEEAFKVASFVGLNKHMAKKPAQLSGGYKRRLSLAIALITSTEMLVADEVAAGVDESARYSILALMDSLKDAGCSVIMTSHDMDAVDRITNRVAVLIKGRLRALDTPEKLKLMYGGCILITLQLYRTTEGKAKQWISEHLECSEDEITTISTRGNEVKFSVQNDNIRGVVKIMSILSPENRPEWITRADVEQTSLQNAFLKFEEEAKKLHLDNIVSITEDKNKNNKHVTQNIDESHSTNDSSFHINSNKLEKSTSTSWDFNHKTKVTTQDIIEENMKQCKRGDKNNGDGDDGDNIDFENELINESQHKQIVNTKEREQPLLSPVVSTTPKTSKLQSLPFTPVLSE